MMAIGLVGELGSGRRFIAEYLEKQGFITLSIQVVKEHSFMIADTLQSNDIRIVVPDITTPGEAELLKSFEGQIVGLTATDETRLQRAKEAGIIDAEAGIDAVQNNRENGGELIRNTAMSSLIDAVVITEFPEKAITNLERTIQLQNPEGGANHERS